MVATIGLKQELEAQGSKNLVLWTRGVDTNLFRPRDKSFIKDKRPILLYVGRVAVEKNIEVFLKLKTPGTKYVVGDGPLLQRLKVKYPDVIFTGMKHGEELAKYYAASDVFVMPSLTETFGLVMLEALASGVPVAALPVNGPCYVIGNSGTGALDKDLSKAVDKALGISGSRCRDYALQYSWEKTVQLFVKNLYPIK